MTTAGPLILGLSVGHHNGAACLMRGDTIEVAVQEERLTRIKRARLVPDSTPLAIDYCLQTADVKPGDLDAIVICAIDPRHMFTLPVHDWSIVQQGRPGMLVEVIPHHLGHAYDAYYEAGFEECSVLVVDGGGSLGYELSSSEASVSSGFADTNHEHLSIYLFDSHEPRAIPFEKLMADHSYLDHFDPRTMPHFRSLGHMYAATAYQIFGDYHAAGKVMGLAPYGSVEIPTNEFLICEGIQLSFTQQVRDRYRTPTRWPDNRVGYADLAASVQTALEAALTAVRDYMIERRLPQRLCYAGGVALNGVANRKVFLNGSFQDVWITPNAEDSGTAIGAAYYGYAKLTGRKPGRRVDHNFHGKKYLLSPADQLRRHWPGIVIKKADSAVEKACEAMLVHGSVGIFRGGSEFGPRALGHRSIVADPRSLAIKDSLNNEIKGRESFRPFAPVVLAEFVQDWFEVDFISRAASFMLDICRVRPALVDLIPGVLNVDGSARIQVVRKEQDGWFYSLIWEFYQRTGIPMLLNTSFNVAGEPIVESPDEALLMLLVSGLEACVLEQYFVIKEKDFTYLELVPTMAAQILGLQQGQWLLGVDTDYGPISYKVAHTWTVLLTLVDSNRTFADIRVAAGDLSDVEFMEMVRKWIHFKLVHVH